MESRDNAKQVRLPKRKKRKKIKLKKYHFADAGSHIHTLGLCQQNIHEEGGNNESKSHRKLRFIIFIIMIIELVRLFSLLIYYHNQEEDIIDEKMFLWFGDLFFFLPQIRIHWTIIIMVGTIRILQTQVLYYRLWRNGRMRCIPMVRLFQVFAGMRSSKELGLGWKDVIKLMKRYANILKGGFTI